MTPSLFRKSTIDELWLVFAALSSVPRSLDEIIEITDMGTARIVVSLVDLGHDGLAELHSFEANEWMLPHDAA